MATATQATIDVENFIDYEKRLDERNLVRQMIRSKGHEPFEGIDDGPCEDQRVAILRPAMNDPVTDARQGRARDFVRGGVEHAGRGGSARGDRERSPAQDRRLRLKREQCELEAR